LNLPERTTVGIVAALRREKGHQFLCEAARLVGRSDFQLLIVGDGLSRGLVRNWVDEHRLTDRTIFAGNQTDVVPWLQAMDVFVLPSWGIEGVPQGIMQAMSCGLPVVSTTVGSIGEAVGDGETGLLVEPRDATQLADALTRLLSDAELRAQFRAASRAKALTQFPIERMLDRMEGVFAEVCGIKSAPLARSG
jgi:glycosyltransferase involved in cell wall biosynthesis